MKRDPNLQDLSRDHHHALVLARNAGQSAMSGTDQEVMAVWRSVEEIFDAELEVHFRVEEEHLLPALAAANERELVRRTLADHRRLRELRAQPGKSRAHLEEFARLLHDHVRFEESELFPAAEEGLSATDLRAVAEASAETEAARRRAEVRNQRAREND